MLRYSGISNYQVESSPPSIEATCVFIKVCPKQHMISAHCDSRLELSVVNGRLSRTLPAMSDETDCSLFRAANVVSFHAVDTLKSINYM